MRKILFSPPDITAEDIQEVADTLLGGWITTGPKTKLFERQIAAYCGNKSAVCLNSATAALELSLRIFGVKEGDEVITSAYTYTASTSVISHVGAKIVLADCQKDSFLIDLKSVEKLITPKTKAIIPVDIAGVMCDYGALTALAESKKNLFNPTNDIQQKLGRILILADAAHSFGSSRNGVISGRGGDMTCFSFHAVKNLTTAEGGAATWKDELFGSEQIYKNFMLLSLHGQDKDAFSKTLPGSWEYDIKMLGYKFNMTDLAASLGISQLKRYDKLLARRHRIIKIYDDILKTDDKIETLSHKGEDFFSCGHLYLTRVKGINEEKRNDIICKMAQKGVPCNVHYKPLPMHTAYKALGFDIKNYPNSYLRYASQITLPLHTLLTDDDAAYIAESLKETVKDI